jgi:hypothetical protein
MDQEVDSYHCKDGQVQLRSLNPRVRRELLEHRACSRRLSESWNVIQRVRSQKDVSTNYLEVKISSVLLLRNTSFSFLQVCFPWLVVVVHRRWAHYAMATGRRAGELEAG